jgi:hypothetical protein
VFVDALDPEPRASRGLELATTGRPGDHPGSILKLWVYG